MTNNLIEWFLDNQLKLAFFLGFICLVIIFLIESDGPQASISFLFSLLFIFAGSKLYSTETSESWVELSYSQLLKSAVGGAFMLIGWTMLGRGVFTFAIAALISKTS